MFYAKYKDASGDLVNKLYFRHEDYIKDTFSPMCERIAIIDFKIAGYGYKKKKEAARNIALAWSNIGDNTGLTYSDVCHISEFFYTVGKRFGLLREFRENGLW